MDVHVVLAQVGTAIPWEQWGLGGLVAGAALAIAAKTIDRVLALVERWTTGEKVPNPDSGVPLFSSLPCRIDPSYAAKIDRIDKTVDSWDDMVQRGDFGCAWKGRDEIRDLLQAVGEGTTAQKQLTREVRTLIEEIRITRRENK